MGMLMVVDQAMGLLMVMDLVMEVGCPVPLYAPPALMVLIMMESLVKR
jgi:hypothetical protein